MSDKMYQGIVIADTKSQFGPTAGYFTGDQRAYFDQITRDGKFPDIPARTRDGGPFTLTEDRVHASRWLGEPVSFDTVHELAKEMEKEVRQRMGYL